MRQSALEKIQAMTALIGQLDRDIALAEAELGMLSHIDDDAQRDALVSNHAEDRQAARQTASDVTRLERHIANLSSERSKIVQRRARAVTKLAKS